MRKPSWDDAPKWANWLAQDKDGSWWWYEEQPEPSRLEGIFKVYGGGTKEAHQLNNDWISTKEQRP